MRRLICAFVVRICISRFSHDVAQLLSQFAITFVFVTRYRNDPNNNLSRDMTKPTMWLCAHRRLRSAWASADAQADLSLRWAHTQLIGFVMSRLIKAFGQIGLGKHCRLHCFHSVCVFYTHYFIVEPHSTNFRIITAIFRVSKYLGGNKSGPKAQTQLRSEIFI